MESLKSFVTTLVTVLIFMSAVELMSPDNKMKKYIKFVLGLILVSVILNPILEFISKGESSVVNGINEYTEVFSQEKKNISSEYNSILNGDDDNDDSRKKSFIENFNKNCDSLLKKKFPEKKFKSEIDCDVDFTNVKLSVRKLRIGVENGNNKVKAIKKVEIGKDKKMDTSDESNDNEEFKEIADYASSELEIPKDKIDVYKIEE